MKTLLICSGGLDSITLAYKIAKEHTLSGLLSFDYGQRHRKELDFARACALWLGVAFHLVDLSGRVVTVVVDLKSGEHEATIWTNDLSIAYVHENSAYST